MKISYPNAFRWRKEVVDETLSLFGQSERKKLEDTLKKITSADISYVIKPLDEEFLDWWLPMYRERVSTKANPTVIDIRHKTLQNPDSAKQYFSLSVLEGTEKMGGVIFSVKKNTLYFAYRTIQYDWKEARMRASPSLYAEYIVAEQAKKLGLHHISHGKDRNPYGLNSSIGLAAFKLSTGCLPQLLLQYEERTLNTDDLTIDAFILECPKEQTPNAPITKAFLVVDDKGLEKWQGLLSFKGQIEIEVIKRKV